MRTMTPIAHRIRSFIGVSGLTLVAAALLPSRFAAALTQDEVLKSISQNVSEQTENHLIEPFFFVALGAIGLIVVFTQWRKRALSPRKVNHQGRLMRELSGNIGLKPMELRQLKALAEEASLSSPLVLLLSPSTMAQAARNSNLPRLDRQVLLDLARRYQLPPTR